MRRVGRTYLGDVEQHLVVDSVARHQEVLADVANTLLQRQTVAAHDERGVDRESDQFQSVLEVTGNGEEHFEEFSGENDDARRSVAHLLILEVGELNKHLGRGMLHFESLQNGRSVVCDRHVADFVHLRAQRRHGKTDEHLIQSNGTERALYDICNGHTRHSYANQRSHSQHALFCVRTSFPLVLSPSRESDIVKFGFWCELGRSGTLGNGGDRNVVVEWWGSQRSCGIVVYGLMKSRSM